MFDMLFDQETVTRNYGMIKYEEGKKKGFKEGFEEGRKEGIKEWRKKIAMATAVKAFQVGFSLGEVRKLIGTLTFAQLRQAKQLAARGQVPSYQKGRRAGNPLSPRRRPSGRG